MPSLIFWATMRIITSTALPAWSGISIRMGFEGYCWAAQGRARAKNAAKANNRFMTRRGCSRRQYSGLARASLRQQRSEIAQLAAVEVGDQPVAHAVLREALDVE